MTTPVSPREACDAPPGGVTGHQNMYLPGWLGAVKRNVTLSAAAGKSTLSDTPSDGLTKACAKVEQLVRLTSIFCPAFTTMVLFTQVRPCACSFTGWPATAVVSAFST